MKVSSVDCPSCGQVFTGKFCATCGEKRVDHHDFTLSHFIEESIESFTHFDNKFFRSFKTLMFRPGSLTINFEAGRKVPFMKPVQLFIICNVLFFFLVAGTNIFAVKLPAYLQPGGNDVLNTREYFYEKFGHDADLSRLSGLFAEKMMSQSKSFIFLFIPFYALACGLLFLRSRKPFALHLVFATHFFCFLLLFFTLFYLLFELPNDHLVHASMESFETFALTLNLTVLVSYFTLATRRFYKTGWLWGVFSGLLAGFLFIVLLQAYRLFLFYNILRTLN